mgnify:CR=1 FL=1
MLSALLRSRRSLLLFAALSLGLGVVAQNDRPGDTDKPKARTEPTTVVEKAVSAASGTEKLDTGESLTFLGKKLWFEVRKRLNLTSESEEAAQKTAEKQVRLKVGSIGLESSSTAPPREGK